MVSSNASAQVDTRALWLGALLAPGLGTRGIHQLVTRLGSIEAVFAASLTQLESCEIPLESAHSIHEGRSLADGNAELERAIAAGLQVVGLDDRRYPEILREIYDPPTVLFVRGDVAALDTYSVAVVGTRHPTVYGRVMAERLGRELARWGLTVTSGLARGIDAESHRACVDAGGRAVAVLGTGADIIYPRENEKLARDIVERGGALVSEFPLGTHPAPHNFPVRNRVISGLSLGVLVVEGGQYSGSRITARMALEQNREVFGVPGAATQKQSWLPNTLIKQGAKLVTEAQDVTEELPSAVRLRLKPPDAPPPSQSSAAPESGENARLLSLLQVDRAFHVDEIVERLGEKVTAPDVLSALFDLELAGRIKQLPGKNFVKRM